MEYESILDTDGEIGYNYVRDGTQELQITNCIYVEEDYITFVAKFENGFQAEISVVRDKNDETAIVAKLYDVKGLEVAQENTDRIYGIHKFKVGDDLYKVEIALLEKIEDLDIE